MDDMDELDGVLILFMASQRLPNKERAVLALRMAGYTQRECGAVIGMTRSAVGIIYKRSLALLRILIGG